MELNELILLEFALKLTNQVAKQLGVFARQKIFQTEDQKAKVK